MLMTQTGIYLCSELNTFLTFGIDCKLYIFAAPYEAQLVYTDSLICFFFVTFPVSISECRIVQ